MERAGDFGSSLLIADDAAGKDKRLFVWAHVLCRIPLAAAGEAEDGNLLGRHLPDHIRPDTARSLRVAAFWLALWLTPLLVLVLTLGPSNVFSQIAIFFSKMAMVTFGGAYAVLAYVAQQAVETYGWLQPGEMLDGLGMAETTPGPLIMVTQFVGFLGAWRDPGSLPPLLAATLGGLLTTWVTFVPCFLWIFFGAPFVEALRANKALGAALGAITAAVIPASAPASGLLLRNRSIKGAPRPMNKKQGTNVHQLASSPPSVPASIGGSVPGSR